MQQLFIKLTLAFCLIAIAHQLCAATSTDFVYPPPKFVRRSMTITLKECLAQLQPTAATATIYQCKVTVPSQTRGEVFEYNTTPGYERPARNLNTRIISTPEAERFGAGIKIWPQGDSVYVMMQSRSINARTGTNHVIKRDDAINEITQAWNANNLDAQSWTTFIWVSQFPGSL